MWALLLSERCTNHGEERSGTQSREPHQDGHVKRSRGRNGRYFFLETREAIPTRNALIEMDDPRGQTLIQTDNSTTHGVCNNNMQCVRSKSWDMRFFWMRCKESQNMFRVYWRPGTTNLADYFTKHHSAAHHRNIQPEFPTEGDLVNRLRLSLQKKPHSFHSSKRFCSLLIRIP